MSGLPDEGRTSRGTASLRRTFHESPVLGALPADFAAAVVVLLHLQPDRTSALAPILARSTALEVRQAVSGDSLTPGVVLVAGPGRHVEISSRRQIHLSDAAREQRVRPACDVLLRSLAAHCGADAASSPAPPGSVGVRGGAPSGLATAQAALEASAIPLIVVDAVGAIGFVNEAARELLQIPPTTVGISLHEAGLRLDGLEVAFLLDRAQREESIHLEGGEARETDDDSRFYDVRANALQKDGRYVGAVIMFIDVTGPHHVAERLARSKQDLEMAYEELESTNEALQSTVEEMETTNEELETINDEIHSSNAQLETVSLELERRTTQLDRVDVDIRSVIDSLRLGVVVLDDLRIRFWNKQAHELWGLDSAEVEGARFLKLDIGLPVGDLVESIRGCLRGDAAGNRITLEGHQRTGKPRRYDVECVPLVDPSDTGGVVLLIESMEPEGG